MSEKYIADLHVHLRTNSYQGELFKYDAVGTIQEMVNALYLRKLPKKINAVAFIGHDSILGNDIAEKYSKKLAKKLGREELIVVPGMEITVNRGISGKKRYHLLVYGDVVNNLGPDFNSPGYKKHVKGKNVREICEYVIDRDGHTTAPHFLTHWGLGKKTVLNPYINSVETDNGFSPPGSNIAGKMYAYNHGLSQTGGSDAHFPDAVGNSITVIDSKHDDYYSILDAIKEGNSKSEKLSRINIEQIRR